MRLRLCLPTALLGIASAVFFVGCGASGAPDSPAPLPACTPSASGAGPVPPASELKDKLPATRVLRRISLAIRGRVPSVEEYESVAAAVDPEPILNKAIDDGLVSTDFYEQLVGLGHRWISVGEFSTGAAGDGYAGNMSTHLGQCGTASKHPGAWYIVGESGYDEYRACDNLPITGATVLPAPVSVEPWWAPGTTVTVVGHATGREEKLTLGGKEVQCASASQLYYNSGASTLPGCGCGPNLVWCYPGSGNLGLSSLDGRQQRRHVWDEPARLMAHLGWYDRPLSDLVTGNYTVGTNMVRAEYLRLARRTGAYPELDQNKTWWRAGDDPSPRDPVHAMPNDPEAWREFVVEELTPFLKAAVVPRAASGALSRTFVWDPKTTKGPSPGIPAAGVLTMPGANSSFARERPRAARFLEIFACQKFTPPPPALALGAPGKDIAKSGTCQHCHRLMDPVAVAFKRWDFGPNGYVPAAVLADVSPWEISAEQLSGIYPYHESPYSRWAKAWIPETVLTPATAADIAVNPGAIADDTIPKSYEIFGAHPDGTAGPLGFGKVLVTSGAFDRCAVQKLYAHFVGHPLDPGAEGRYISELATEFAANGRRIRPFVRVLLGRPEFRRGL